MISHCCDPAPTVSDRVSAGAATDRSGSALRALLQSGELFPAETLDIKVVPDEKQDIQVGHL